MNAKIKKQTEGRYFSLDSIVDFDTHISNSILGYYDLNSIIIKLSKRYVREGSNTYDLGCSKGTLLHMIYLQQVSLNASYVGYDISENLLPKLANARLNYFKRDVTDPKLKLFNTNLVLSVFTLQFLNYENRQALIERVYESLNYNGAFIVAEKIIGDCGESQDILSVTARQFKRQNFTDDEILGKESKLQSIMQPLTSDHNEDLFVTAGFRKVICIWQTLNFKAWILIK